LANFLGTDHQNGIFILANSNFVFIFWTRSKVQGEQRWVLNEFPVPFPKHFSRASEQLHLHEAGANSSQD